MFLHLFYTFLQFFLKKKLKNIFHIFFLFFDVFSQFYAQLNIFDTFFHLFLKLFFNLQLSDLDRLFHSTLLNPVLGENLEVLENL